ncbi:MAG TPA: metallophosphoesterase [Opitutaceae bacterium]
MNPPRRRLFTRRRFFAALASGAALTGLYAWRVEPHWIEFVRRDLPIEHLPLALEGRTLVQVSDLHCGPQVDDAYLIDTFRRIQALAPDIVVHTGDLVTVKKIATEERLRSLLSHFPHGRLGTAAVLGNHDYGWSWKYQKVAGLVVNAWQNAGVVMLRDAVVDMGGLQLVGLEELWSQRLYLRGALRQLDAGRAALALCHNPDVCDLPDWDGFRGWILAGHTHGGQCRPPFLPPPILPVKNRRYTSGEFELSGGRRLYINRGVGHLWRVRFNVRPEVTVFRLVQA